MADCDSQRARDREYSACHFAKSARLCVRVIVCDDRRTCLPVRGGVVSEPGGLAADRKQSHDLQRRFVAPNAGVYDGNRGGRNAVCCDVHLCGVLELSRQGAIARSQLLKAGFKSGLRPSGRLRLGSVSMHGILAVARHHNGGDASAWIAFVIFGAAIAIAIAATLYGKRLRRKRTELMEQIAGELGLEFRPLGSDGLVAQLDGFDLFSKG